ncbi:hypothetical protein [Nonomuraea cavernae]|uniref:hypothetical protein n=1 Tax=Nonomuraea cavernae TaxID=2045107 RepID=UPI0033F26292
MTLSLVNTVMPYIVVAISLWLILTGRLTYVKGGLSRPDPSRAGTFSVPVEAQERARELVMAGKRVEAIREIRRATNLPLDSALDIIEALRQGDSLPDKIVEGSPS